MLFALSRAANRSIDDTLGDSVTGQKPARLALVPANPPLNSVVNVLASRLLERPKSTQAMHRILFSSFSPFLIWLSIIPLALSKAVNRSIDDTLGDSVTGQRPLFLPPTVGVWEDATCAECTLQPPIQDAYDQTWTAATYRPPMGNMSISFPFTGTAIYVFFILSNIITHNSTTAANFTLDGVLEGAYLHSPDPNAPAFQFNESALAFTQTGLENSTHYLLISTSGDETIFVNFDYALYTFEEEDNTSIPSSSSTELSSATGSSTTSNTAKHSASSTGAIVGGIIGGVIALCALTAVMFIYHRQRRRKVHQDEVPSIIEYRSTYIPSGSLPSTKQLSMMHHFPSRTSPASLAASSSTPEAEPHQIRQLELQRQVRAIQEAIEMLQNEARLRDQHDGSASYPQAGLPIPSRSRKFRRNRRINETVDVNVQQLNDHIQAMTAQVAFLQSQQNSAWVRAAVNRSIDDTLGDSVTGQKPLYLPPTVGIWEDATCKECALRPSIQDAYDQTWTAATYHPKLGNMSISFPFTGTAIYVFFILANISSHNSTTATNFTLDGVLVEGAYIHIADPDAPAFQFNESALAFAQTGLENSTHNLIISTSGDETIFVNFDYALYTFEEEDDTSVPSSSSTDLSSATGSSTTSTTSTTSKHSDSSKGAIVGGIIGGLLALCVLTSVMFIYYRHQRRRIGLGVHQDEMPSIFHTDPDPHTTSLHPIYLLQNNYR
ncbi:hypothetical protein D9757_005059 [Collybiopsis confluens]|uniref:Uncharacterized protein n=1 Tax=Collybiopsis confluens TaxID=2823264 RepID=A0A8H5MC14_9AGAR|nr:hypothetical protein D9757_005059 [Collybiopsis confluens]